MYIIIANFDHAWAENYPVPLICVEYKGLSHKDTRLLCVQCYNQ
jgi:hypothetical protein